MLELIRRLAPPCCAALLGALLTGCGTTCHMGDTIQARPEPAANQSFLEVGILVIRCTSDHEFGCSYRPQLLRNPNANGPIMAV